MIFETKRFFSEKSGKGGFTTGDSLLLDDNTAYMYDKNENNDSTIIGQLQPSIYPRFCGLTTFCRLPQMNELLRNGFDWDIGIVGIPWDNGTSYRTGARFGPNSIREQSRIYRPYNLSLDTYPFENVQCCDCGDIPVTPFDINKAVTQIEDGLSNILSTKVKNDSNKNGKKLKHRGLAVIGGDHTLSYPCIKTMYQHNNKTPLSLIHFDAHLDTNPSLYDSDIWHGSPFRKVFEENLINVDNSIHIGLRNSLYNENDLKNDENMGFKCLFCDDIHNNGIKWTIEKIINCVTNNNNKDIPVYISVDIDVLDPSVAPGTGTPEIGGLFSHQLLQILKGLNQLNVVSCDVVEVSPTYDVPNGQITSLAAAGVLYQMISLMAITMQKQHQ